MHDAFLIAGQRIGGLRDPDRLRPWLYAIVRHECLRQLRAAKHAQASNVEVTAQVHNGTLKLRIDGVGGADPAGGPG